MPFSLYTNTTPAQTRGHLLASGARILFAERRLLDRLGLGSDLDIDHLVLIDQGPEPVAMSHFRNHLQRWAFGAGTEVPAAPPELLQEVLSAAPMDGPYADAYDELFR